MSIYASSGQLMVQYEGFGDTEWVEVWVQSVPPHIGHPSIYTGGDPYADFLPPPASDPNDWSRPRAVVFVLADTPKQGQQYVDPLLVLTGAEWASLPFPEVLQRIEDAVAEAMRAGRCKTCGRRNGEGGA